MFIHNTPLWLHPHVLHTGYTFTLHTTCRTCAASTFELEPQSALSLCLPPLSHPPTQDLHCVNVSSKAAVNPGAFDLLEVYSITKSAAHFMFGSLATRGARVLQVG